MQFFGKSDIGVRRSENQDSFVTEQLYDNTVLCLVCDGMGGANGGSIASSLACNTFLKHVKKKMSDIKTQEQLRFDEEDANIENMLKKAVTATNTAVFRKANRDKQLSGMGTTLVCALIVNRNLYAVNVGDSRLYFVNDEKLVQLTRDHSYVQTLIDLGQITPEEASSNPHKNIITKAIGTQKKEEPDIFFKNLSHTNCRYLLLCSDGLTNFVDEKVIHSIITGDDTLEEKCSELIATANKNGGGDNITAVLIKLDGTEEGDQADSDCGCDNSNSGGNDDDGKSVSEANDNVTHLDTATEETPTASENSERSDC